MSHARTCSAALLTGREQETATSAPGVTRVTLVSAHLMLRTMIASWLESTTPVHTTSRIRTTSLDRHPDPTAMTDADVVVVIDAGTSPDPTALDDAATASRAGPGVIYLGRSLSPAVVSHAIDAGVRGLVDLSDDVSDLACAIWEIDNGSLYVSDTARDLLGERGRHNERRVHLSQRETETARLIIEGLPLKSVAVALNVSIETTRSYVRRIKEKYAGIGIDVGGRIAFVTQLEHELRSPSPEPFRP